jgi:hypothetical protein
MQKRGVKKEVSEWVDEDKISEMMGLKKRTLQKYVWKGIIPESAIIRTITGKRKYHYPTLIGLNQN